MLNRCFFSVLMLIVTQSTHAQSWVDVGDGFYVERYSSKRNGDIATVLMRHISKMDYTDEVTFDCKNGLATNWNWANPIPTKDRPSLLKAQEIACRRSWEIWK
jgi:hypothetical protein